VDSAARARLSVECFADGLTEPLLLIGIVPGSDQGRVRVQVAGKSAREKGFCIKREALIPIGSVRAFLRKMGESDRSDRRKHKSIKA
jgi:hypothetical protein